MFVETNDTQETGKDYNKRKFFVAGDLFAGVAGMFATIVHDSVMTPVDGWSQNVLPWLGQCAVFFSAQNSLFFGRREAQIRKTRLLMSFHF